MDTPSPYSCIYVCIRIRIRAPAPSVRVSCSLHTSIILSAAPVDLVFHRPSGVRGQAAAYCCAANAAVCITKTQISRGRCHNVGARVAVRKSVVQAPYARGSRTASAYPAATTRPTASYTDAFALAGDDHVARYATYAIHWGKFCTATRDPTTAAT
jgi:hypothetical protein